MKRSLEVLVEPNKEMIVPPRVLRAGDTTLMVFDEGDGTASSRLASWLAESGATPLDAELEIKANPEGIRIVIRATAVTAEARKRAAALESAADVVLGSARPAFAKRLLETLLSGRPHRPHAGDR